MDRRGLRAILVLGLAITPLMALLVVRADVASPVSAAVALGGPHSSMAGSTTFAAVGPTAIPGSSVWDDVLSAPSPASSGGAPNPGKPGKTPSPTAGPAVDPTTNPTLRPASNPTAGPTSPSATKPKPTANSTVAPTTRPTTAPTAAPTANPAPCSVFPSTNVWNRPVDTLAVRSDSATLISSIGLSSYLHPDFSSTAYNGGVGYGIPINKVNLSTPTYPVSFQYASESDKGPYPIPASPKIEGGSDRHLISWDTQGCKLYELFAASFSGGKWHAGSGAIWDLRSNALRPDGWTSADAAGLPILPGLIRYEEVAAGAIRHAIRFTAPDTRSAHIYPARHDASDDNSASLPPMGLRVRLKASVDISGFGPQARVILTALKRYGMILADNGSPWYVTGAPNASWDDDQLHDFHELHGSDFEVVDTTNFR
jgi:hypothetical protein